MAEDVTLSAAVRFNQATLQNAADFVARAQKRLPGPASQSAASVSDVQTSSVVSRASDFAQMKQDMAQGIGALSAATDAIGNMMSAVRQLRGLVQEAKAAGDQGGSDTFAAQFDFLRKELDSFAAGAQYQGVNLIDGSTTTLKISVSVSTTEVTAIQGGDLRSGALGIGQTPAGGGGLDTMLGTLDKAMGTLQAQSQQYSASVTMLQMKLDVSVSMETSQNGGTTFASLTEEGANLLALQTRQQLGTQALSFAGQAEQGVLGLFK